MLREMNSATRWQLATRALSRSIQSFAMIEIAPTEERGSLGVMHLKRLWSRRMRRGAVDGINMAYEWGRDIVLIHGLGVGLEQASRFLGSDRTFEEFEVWVLALNGGFISPSTVARLNAALSGEPFAAETASWLGGVQAMPPVLDETDLRMWEERGYVVLHDAITPAQCAAVAELVYESVGARPDDPETWYSRANSQGIMVQIFQHPTMDAARQSVRIHKAFAQLWGTADLLPTNDRCGFNPPERTGFTFPGPHLHWDAELKPPMPFATQGIIYLTHTTERQGAFSCVPGFQNVIDEWLRALPSDVEAETCIRKEKAAAINGRAGDLIIWHQSLPHGSSPNRAAAPRVVQYLNMFPMRPQAVGNISSNA